MFTSFAAFFIANPHVMEALSEKFGGEVYTDDNSIVLVEGDQATIASVQLYTDADGDYLFVAPWGQSIPDFTIRPVEGTTFTPFTSRTKEA